MPYESTQLNLGGIEIFVRAPQALFLGSRLYEPFLGPKRSKNDLNISVKLDSPGILKTKKALFDTDSWRLSSINSDKLLYEEPVLEQSYPMYARKAVIEKQFSKVTLYLTKLTIERSGLLDVIFDIPLGQFLMQNLLAKNQGLLAHCCAVKNKTKGFVFMGPSGSGKTTLAGIWKDVEGTTVLNDERIIIRKAKGRFFIYGTPWTGSGMVCSNASVLLNRIYFIRHAPKNYVKPVKLKDLLQIFLTNIRLPLWDKKRTEKVLALAGEILKEIPVFELGFLPDKRILDHVIT